MKRRDFITLLGGAAAMWPLAARAQQGNRGRRIGMLSSRAADDPEAPVRVAAFAQGLEQLGWSVGGNLRIEYRWSTNDAERRKFAAELVALAPDVILGESGAVVGALQQASRTIPIVFVNVIDPVGGG
jgi:putative ABC transport system substrate-binding protein